MKILRDRHGFTLVEVLVAVAVMAIITILAFPSIKQFQASNAKKKYETYQMTAEAAAKLYVDAYAKDMFGYNYTGCYDIPFKDLESSNLLKEYADSSITCMGYDGNESYVYINKNGDKYDYSVRMVCIKKSDDPNADPVMVYETSADEVRSCSGNTGKIEVKFEGITKNKWVKNADVIVKVISENGLLENTKLTYCLKTEPNGLCHTTLSVKNFMNTRGEAELGFGFNIEGMSGKYYLFVGTNYIRDIYGNVLSGDVISDVIQVDNEAPINLTLNNPYEGKWATTNYTIKASATDKHSGLDHYECKYGRGGTWAKCSGTGSNLNNININSAYVNSTVYVRACDKVGNCTDGNTSTSVKKTTQYTITLNNNGATSAGTPKLYVRKNLGIYTDTNGTTAVLKIVLPQKTNYVFDGYYTGTNGSGTKMINADGTFTSSFRASSVNSSATYYAKWRLNTINVTYDFNGNGQTNSTAKVNYGSYYNVPNVTTPLCQAFLGWYDSDGNQITNTTPMTKTVDHTITARWDSNYVVATYANVRNYISFSGSWDVLYDNGGWYIKFYSNGTLTLNKCMVVDLSLVGGGGGGGGARDDGYSCQGGGGGSAGYTANYSNISLKNGSYWVSIGAGGSGGWPGGSFAGSGGQTSIGGYAASGGGGSRAGSAASSGGSGGGASGNTNWGYIQGGTGGSNGSNGSNTGNGGGIGQGSSTYGFQSYAYPIYSGGGGGGTLCRLSGNQWIGWYYPQTGGYGGNGGGARGGGGDTGATGWSAGANTGAGGGGGGCGYGITGSGGNGGSGIALMRNKR